MGSYKEKIPSNSSITFLWALHKNLTFPDLCVPTYKLNKKASFLPTVPPGNGVRITLRKDTKLL